MLTQKYRQLPADNTPGRSIYPAPGFAIIWTFLLVAGIMLAAGIIGTGMAYGQTSERTLKTEALPEDTLFKMELTKLISASDVDQKEAIYKDLLQRFPENGTTFRRQSYTNARMSLALFWSSRGNAARTMDYYHQISEGLSTGFAVAMAANLVQHAQYKPGLTILDGVMKEVTDAANTGKGSAYTFLQAYECYARALFHLGKKEEALDRIQQAYDKSDKKNTSVNSTYAMVLHGLDQHADALPIMEQLIRDGMARREIRELYKDSYAKKNGSADGLDRQLYSMQRALKTQMRQEASEKLVNEPAVAFSMNDMAGKAVTLNDFAGKVVVLDFWATWCGPCIRSMPAMQLTAHKYKNDPAVQFLFVNTGEKTPDYRKAVRKLLDENRYDFRVLLDERDTATKKCPVAAAYGIKGIPTKLILDGGGNIRYRLVGFNGGDDATVEELSAMIENVKQEMIPKSPFTIKGTSYLQDGIAILNDYENPDTAKIVNGRFEFKGSVDRHNMISIEVPPTRSSRIILEPGTITVDHTKAGYRFGGAPLNIRFQKIEDALKPLNDRITALWSKYNKAEGEERIKIWREYDQAKTDKMAKALEITVADGSFAGFMETLPVARYETAANLKKYLDAFKQFADDPRYRSLQEFYKGVANTDNGVVPPQWTLPDQQGNSISLAALKGKYILIDFWYSGCHWCRKMTPGLINIYKELKDRGFEIVSVSVDPKKDEDKWRAAMKEDGAPWLQAWDAEKTLPDQYSVQGYPTMFFLGPDGKILQKIIGYHDEPILKEFFLSHMNRSGNNAAKR